MATYEQLEAEPWWDREIVTDDLDWLGDQLCALSGQPRSAFGTKGNNLHLNGGHRSQEWILNSVFCTNQSYTVRSGLNSDQLRHIAAGDFTPGLWGTTANRALMVRQTRNLWDAARAGGLPGVTQVMGTLNGKNPIGLNVRSGTTFTPDSSHVDHWHLTIDRLFLRDRGLMTRIRDTALGGDMAWDEVINYPGTPQTNPNGYPAGQILIGTNQAAFNAWNEAKTNHALLEQVLLKLGADPAELEALKQAARAGAEAGVVASAALLAAAVAEALSHDLGLTPAEAEAAAERAVRRVLGSVDN